VTALDIPVFDLYPGQGMVVIGDNGTGKFTMIKALAGAIPPDTAEITLAGELVQFFSPGAARDIGIESAHQTPQVHGPRDPPGRGCGRRVQASRQTRNAASGPHETLREPGFVTNQSVDQKPCRNPVGWAASGHGGGIRVSVDTVICVVEGKYLLLPKATGRGGAMPRMPASCCARVAQHWACG